MTGPRLLFVFLTLTLLLRSAHSLTPDPREQVVDPIALVESVLAPFMAFTGGGLYSSQQGSSHPSVCGHAGSAASPLVLPVTLTDLDRLHNALSMPHAGEQAVLDMVESCYLRRDGKDMPCVVSLHSLPEDCSMNINESTNYWNYRRMTVESPESASIFNGGADLFVENVLHVQGLRERLRHSLLRTQASTKAGRQLWEIASQGWNTNNNAEANQTFVNTVSARGAAIVGQAYADVMDKWNVVKEWLRTSVGEIDIKVPTYTTTNGSLLGPQVYCNPSIYLDDWLTDFDEVMYGFSITYSVEREIEALFTGHKIFPNRTTMRVNKTDRLPCLVTSFAVAMMLLEDFPVRIAYSDMVNETGSTDAPWPLKRFAMLGDSEGKVSRNCIYLLNTLNTTLAALTEEPYVTDIFDGNVPLAACVRQAVLRAPGIDGKPPPSSIYECISLMYDPSWSETLPSGSPIITQSVIGLENEDDIVRVHYCPWGFIRPGGNIWDMRENCVMCLPGSFDGGDGECSCGADFYPDPGGCVAKFEMYTSSPVLEWRVDPAKVITANIEESSALPFLIVKPPDSATASDRVVLSIQCSEGLTQFEVSMPEVNGSYMSGGPTFIPLQRALTIVSSTTIAIRLASSAAFGAEQCDFRASIRNPMYRDSPPLHAGTLIIVPALAETQVYTQTPSSGLSFSNSERTIFPCDKIPRNESTAVNVGVCSMKDEKMAVAVRSQSYTPFTMESFRILKQAVWAENKRATELGNTMKMIGDRIRLYVQMTLTQDSATNSSTRVIHSQFSILNDSCTFFELPGSPEHVTLEFRIVDRCATTSGTQDTNCVNAKLLFAGGKVNTMNFELTNITTTKSPEDSDNEKEEEEGKSSSPTTPWWRVPLIALVVADTVLLITVGVLIFVCVWYIRTAARHSTTENECECPHDSVPLATNSAVGGEDGGAESNETSRRTSVLAGSLATVAPY